MPVLSYDFVKVLSAGSTSTGFTDQEPSATVPAGDGVIDLLSPTFGWGWSNIVPSYIGIIPFGTDGDNDTFDFRVFGIARTMDTTPLYIPQLLVGASVTLGSDSGCDGAAIVTNGQMADTIVINQGPTEGPFLSVISPTNNTPAGILLHTRGFRWLKFDWDLAGAQEGVTMNAYIRAVDSLWNR